MGKLTSLTSLSLHDNDLTGKIPAEVGKLSSLESLQLAENNLSGSIPAELGKLTNLVGLSLYDNDLEGEIPREIGGLAKLQELSLYQNELSGEIPDELGQLSDLTDLRLNSNYLSGQIPWSLNGLTKLTSLRLADNGFTGCLPEGLTAVSDSDAGQLGLETCYYEPDQELIDDAWSYARDMEEGFDHVLRWMRVLNTLEAVEDMTAAEAQGNADTHLAERWDPVVEELRKLEDAQVDYEPDQDVIDDVWSYARETDNGFDHVLRWMRVLTTFGVVEDMTAAEAQGYADRGWERWDPVVEELKKLEASTS